MSNKLTPRDFFSRYLYKIIGALCGVALGILFLTVGFWKTLLLGALALIGWFVGARADGRWASRMKATLARILGVDRNDAE